MSKKNKPSMILKATASFGTSSASAELKVYDRYDFIPVVTINEDEKGENIIYSTEECTECNKDKLDLGEGFTENLQDYLVPEIVIAKNSVSKIPLKILQGHDPFGFQDNDGIVEFSSSNSKVTIMPKSKKVSYSDKIEIEIKHTLGRGEKFSIDIKGKDDDDDSFESSDTIVTSGKLNVSVIQKDVFMEDEAQRVIDEILFIAPFADNETAPEYDENYCMQAAERSVSELFQNYIDFYSVDRSHKHRNKIGFSGKNAIDRGNKFNSLGYVKVKFEYDSYKIDHSKRKSIIDTKSYKKVRYDILELKNNNLQDFFNKQVSKNIGFHIFYFAITSGFHTLMLIINNTDPCNSTYTIYDQHGETSSKGFFKDISEGIKKQTCWTFANTCLNRYNSHLKNNNKKHLQWDSTETTLWKMQRK
ncbi:hypothetical protein G1K97_13375 [Tenacibaculum finnmarkense]|uniref:hypothetical protein n=2 Tax=Tenacibaculum finnmarkense TaxID=2781243 RepID=UPI000C5730AA|nr:hypothetical protein [Tenacibaculum finnmarkense]MCD8440915.1 hypothetical protein [Tenacibaculum finnmarkense genomovar ulcerans]MCG8721832.1 hypothetical protein [Tenacibaculum finnmarkense]MCG8902823.1 hypothetical protein [Tenacibaculum finnmarkense]SOS56317.1 hypothetical protein TFHFJT_760001 [Tenacibaculum finnmarkense]